MRKIIILFLLIIINITLFLYLKKTIAEQYSMNIKIKPNSLIYQFKEILIEDTDSFELKDYIGFVDQNSSCSHYFDDEKLIVKYGGKTYSFDYEIKEPEVIEKVVIKEVIVEKEVHSQIKPADNHHEETISYDEEEDYFYLTKSSDSFSCGTDISTIISTIQQYLVTNKRVTVDYSDLNPYQSGNYIVRFISDSQELEFSVEIIQEILVFI